MTAERAQRRLAWLLAAPAFAFITAIALVPVAWTAWESLHQHDLRFPDAGRPFIGMAHYVDLIDDDRFWGALLNTFAFTATSVALELVLGLALALALHRWMTTASTGIARTLALLPWAIPTVIAATVWRFLFEGSDSLANAALGVIAPASSPAVWFADPWLAWVPILCADVWKTTPFVALLLLAGLQQIDEDVRSAAFVDGASAWRELWHVTLPLLRPALLVALIFRTLDALRVFDLIYVMTAGGPGTATEPVALYAHTTLLRHLRFGQGSAISVVLFAVTMILALAYLRALGRTQQENG